MREDDEKLEKYMEMIILLEMIIREYEAGGIPSNDLKPIDP